MQLKYGSSPSTALRSAYSFFAHGCMMVSSSPGFRRRTMSPSPPPVHTPDRSTFPSGNLGLADRQQWRGADRSLRRDRKRARIVQREFVNQRAEIHARETFDCVQLLGVGRAAAV